MNSENNEFFNKKVVITGATSGIGKACATYFLNSGAQVILCGRDEEALKKIGEKYKKQVITVKLDIQFDMQIFDLKSTVIENLGNFDIMINCAGVMFDSDVESTFPQDFDYTIDVNLRSCFLNIRFFDKFYLPGQTIINVSCMYGSRPYQGCIAHALSKAGLEALTRYAAAELAEKKVRVNAVSASLVNTNSYRFTDVSELEFGLIKKKVANSTPLQRVAQPEDVVKAILFFASNSRSGSITGEVLKVDGGRTLTSSGYVPWKGMRNMNSRFEPTGEISKGNFFSNTFSNLFGKGEERQSFPIEEEKINTILQESKWNDERDESHQKIQERILEKKKK